MIFPTPMAWIAFIVFIIMFFKRFHFRIIGYAKGGVSKLTLGQLRDKADQLIAANPHLADEPVHFFAGDELGDLYADDQEIVVVE